MQVHIVPVTLTGKFYKWYSHTFFTHPGKTRMILLLRKLFSAGIRMQDQRTKAVFQLDVNDLLTSIILQYGNYEPRSLNLALDIAARTEGVFLDVGSNFGLYTCLLTCGANKKAIAVDASYKAFALLQRNVQANAKAGEVFTCNVALSASGGLHYFSPFHESNLGSSRVVTRESATANKFLVASVPLQQILEAIDPPKIALMKMDVEGFEEEVLKGLDLQGKYRPQYILMEYEVENNPSVSRILQLLLSHDYEACTVENHPYTEGMPVPESNLLFKSKI